MKEYLSKEFYGNNLGDWAISFGILIGSIIIAKVLYWFIKKYIKGFAHRTKSGLDDILVDKLEEPVVFGIVMAGVYWAYSRLHFSAGIDNFFDHVMIIIITINITWLIVRVLDSIIEEYVVPIVEKTESDLDDQLLPIVRKTIKALLWTLGIIVGLNNAGFDVAALLAGLGIGGLALALAAQDTVKNIFGGIMVFLDKPFKLNDRIKIAGFDGSVEEIGVRSTRLRTLEGRLITIPNGQFSDNAVENVSLEPTRKITVNLGLTYETTPEKMERALQILKEISEENNNISDDVLMSFNSWGDFAMGILFIYFIKPEADIFEVQTQMNMEILKRFNAEGLEFAYPTQTIYRK